MVKLKIQIVCQIEVKGQKNHNQKIIILLRNEEIYFKLKLWVEPTSYISNYILNLKIQLMSQREILSCGRKCCQWKNTDISYLNQNFKFK